MHNIHTIMEGLGHVKTSNRFYKRYVQVARWEIGHAEVFITSNHPQSATSAVHTITFTKEKAFHIIQPHDDVLMFTLQIANHNVHKMLVNNGSSVDVLFCAPYNKLGLLHEVLKPISIALYDFSSCSIQPPLGGGGWAPSDNKQQPNSNDSFH